MPQPFEHNEELHQLVEKPDPARETVERLFNESIQMHPKLPTSITALATGDTLTKSGNQETLKSLDGYSFSLKSHDPADGLQRWNLTNGGREVNLVPQEDKVMRQPLWYDLTDGGRITFNGDKTEIKFGSGELVNFDSNGIKSVSRDGITQVLGERVDNKPTPPLYDLPLPRPGQNGEHGEYATITQPTIEQIMEQIRKLELQQKLPRE